MEELTGSRKHTNRRCRWLLDINVVLAPSVTDLVFAIDAVT
jgi:hypothetical protein